MATKPTDYAFTNDFTSGLVRGFIEDPTVSRRLAKNFKPSRLTDKVAAVVLEAGIKYQTQYGNAPTVAVIGQELSNKVASGAMTQDERDAAIDYLATALSQPGVSSAYLINEVLEEERQQAVFDALSSGLLSWNRGAVARDSIAANITRAVSLGKEAAAEPAVDYFANLQARTNDRLANIKIPRLATGVGPLDQIIVGGLAAGELGCVLGGPKQGKSQFLGMCALTALTAGIPVIYYTAEMNPAAIIERMDAAVSRTPTSDFYANAKHVHDCVLDFASMSGEFRVKYVHPGSTTVNDLEDDLRAQALDGFTPGLVVVDYGDLLTSSRHERGEKRHEELGAVYTDLRKMAVNWKVPVWTASQAKREALEKQVVTIADVGESYKKVQIADLVVALCGTEEERQQKIIRMYVAACRFASGGQSTGPMKSAFEMGRIWDDMNEAEDI